MACRGVRRGKRLFIWFRRSPWRPPLHLSSPGLFEKLFIGLVGFEPTACRRGDRSKTAYRDRLYLFPLLKYRSRCAASARVAKPSLWTRTHGTPCFVALDSPALCRRIRSVKFSQEPT